MQAGLRNNEFCLCGLIHDCTRLPCLTSHSWFQPPLCQTQRRLDALILARDPNRNYHSAAAQLSMVLLLLQYWRRGKAWNTRIPSLLWCWLKLRCNGKGVIDPLMYVMDLLIIVSSSAVHFQQYGHKNAFHSLRSLVHLVSRARFSHWRLPPASASAREFGGKLQNWCSTKMT